MKRNLLAAAFILAAAPAFAANLTDDELKFQQVLKDTDPKAYAEAVENCDRKKGAIPTERVECWRMRLAAMADAYVKADKPVVAQGDPTASWTPIEKSMIALMSRDPEFKKTYDEATAAVKKDPVGKAGAYVKAFREPIQKMMGSYASNGAGYSQTTHTKQVIKEAKAQLPAVLKNPEGNFDGNTLANGKNQNVVAPDPGGTEEDRKRALSQINNDGKGTGTASQDVPVPDFGKLTPEPVAAKPDKNKWNNEIAGLKGAAWAGMIALILGGPVGAVVFGAIGFGAFTAISAHNNR